MSFNADYGKSRTLIVLITASRLKTLNYEQRSTDQSKVSSAHSYLLSLYYYIQAYQSNWTCFLFDSDPLQLRSSFCSSHCGLTNIRGTQEVYIRVKY